MSYTKIVTTPDVTMLVCPACNGDVGSLNWILSQQRPRESIWACKECHQRVSFSVADGKVTDVQLTGRHNIPAVCLLESDLVDAKGDRVYLFHETYIYDQPIGQTSVTHEAKCNLIFLYEDNTCPTNYIRGIMNITYQGDTDPHGVFRLVNVWTRADFDRLAVPLDCNGDPNYEVMLELGKKNRIMY